MGSIKVFGKTITELVKSSDLEEQRKWYRAAKQVLKTILEVKTLRMNESFGIEDIYSGDYSLLSLDSIAKIKWFSKAKQLLAYNLDEKKFFMPPDIDFKAINTTSVEQLEILPIDEKDVQTMDASKKVSKEIQATLADVVWQGKRWELVFDPEKKTLASRSKSIEIDPTVLKIKWLNMAFKDFKELVYVANLMNRIHYKYPGVKDFYFGSRLRSGMDYGIYRSESGMDTQILDLDVIKEKMPSLLDANNDVKTTFIDYLNNNQSVQKKVA